VLTIVLAMTLAVTTPALAQGRFAFKVNDKGEIVHGRYSFGKCSDLQRDPFHVPGRPDQPASGPQREAVRACEKAGFSVGPEVTVATVMETTMVNGSPVPVPIPSSGGPAILLPSAALLLGSGILTYAILRRR
jgi:hypothetical protein